ncbi:hypothetical protein GCM10009820_25380 [Leifsonia soli]
MGSFPRWVRWAFGRPRIIHAVLWGILGAACGALGVSYAIRGLPNWWPWFLATLWAWAIAGAYLFIALRDRGRGTGAYAPPAAHRRGQDW